MTPATDDELTDIADKGDALEQGSEADVEAHIAVENMTELVRHNPLELLAVEVVDAFLEEGLIVYTEGRIRESASRFEASADDVANVVHHAAIRKRSHTRRFQIGGTTSAGQKGS